MPLSPDSYASFGHLAEKAAKGDQDALERLWANLAPHAWKHMRNKHGADMADELLNEVFIKVFKNGIPNLDKFAEFEYAKSYIFKACDSVFCSRARKFSYSHELASSTETIFESASGTIAEDAILADVALGHFRTKLDGNLLATYDAWRTALKQTTCLHDSYVEVANEMGLPVTTVKKRCLGLRAKLTAIYSMS